MNTYFQAFESFFIHQSQQDQIEDYGRARIFLYALLIVTFFSSSYSVYYELTHSDVHIVKHIANLVGLLTGPFGLVLLKYNGNFKRNLFVLLVLSVTLVFTSTFFSGGIYSIDIIWMIIIAILTFLFIGNREGIFMTVIALVNFLVFWIMDKMGVRDFEQDNIQLGLSYQIYNLFFLLLMASFSTFFFVKGAERTKRELNELKERQVKSLDYKYRYIAENANEIIALHKKNGETTFISGAVHSVLGFSKEEMLGNTYLTYIEAENMVNQQLKCQTKEGNTVYLDITFTPIKDEIRSGEVFISMARNVTDMVLENKKITQLRQQIANDFHDEMGNKLAAITLNSNILALKISEQTELTDLIFKIEDTSKSLYQHSRDFIWSIDAKSDELREIFSYLRDFGEDFFQSLPINFIVESKGFSEQEKVVLPMYWGRHILLIFKEVLTNSAKHSQCQNLILSMSILPGTFTISVKDDGKGFGPSHAEGRGLNSIKERAKIIQSEIRIETSATGTKITLVGKLPKLGEGNV